MTDWMQQSVWMALACVVGVAITTTIAGVIVQRIQRKWQAEHENSVQELTQMQQRLERAQQEIHQLEKEALTLEQQFAAAQEIWQQKEHFFEQQKRQNEVQFKQLAQEIIQQQGARLATENEKQLSAILSPLGQKIHEFQQRVEQSYDQEARERFSLVKEIKNLQLLNQRISDDAMSLTEALKGQNKVQGGWGEVILERILERSGLEKGREYEVQVSLNTEDGKRYQPDVIVHLPENKQIIIDSKMVLVSYLAYVEAEDDITRQQALRQHLDAIRRHMKELSAKNYHDLKGITSLDFVIMFIPIEAAYGLALQAENGLFSEAFEHNIIITGPSNLLATLRTVQNIWRNEKQSQNALEIARQAGAMYDKFAGFVQDMDDIGAKIDTLSRSHDQAMKKLSIGRGNLMSRAERLRMMGAKTNKQLTLPEDDQDEV
ncbi:DNA recombination protein RmuC [Marinomonas communis]|uniref:DNA recombination protein RmuC n=1 Tax=Marinomonas communis TaxID=28254 RepID=UPI0010024412|nr:DNA recombination protein RmuC [Marinomonas communis]MCC4275078.1 DNA recombination protein RmuC [Marinomonas communis]RUM50187.1 MAG: DNA recombination protein RmuC [Marinomonas sp.]